VGISIGANCIFTQFLPTQKAQCAEWKINGLKIGKSKERAYIFMFVVFIVVGYGIMASVLLLDTNTSCLKLFGGAGC
jgi:hypothetical protein